MSNQLLLWRGTRETQPYGRRAIFNNCFFHQFSSLADGCLVDWKLTGSVAILSFTPDEVQTFFSQHGLRTANELSRNNCTLAWGSNEPFKLTVFTLESENIPRTFKWIFRVAVKLDQGTYIHNSLKVHNISCASINGYRDNQSLADDAIEIRTSCPVLTRTQNCRLHLL